MSNGDPGYLSPQNQSYLYNLLVEAAIGYAIFTLNAEGEIVSWNSGAKRLLGYEEKEIIGKPVSIIFTPEDKAAGGDKWELQTAESTGQAENERWHVRKDGTRFFGSGFMFPLKSEDGRLEGFAKIMRDNTERRLAEESLERANQELQRRIAEETARRSAETSLTHALADFQMLMDSMTDCAIVLLDKNGGVVDWNRGSENILQYRRDEVMGRNLDFIHTPEDLERQSWQDELQCARLKGRSVEDKWLVRKNGERFFSSGILQPMLDEAGQLRGFAKIMRDITKRKLAEEEANYLANHDLLTGLPNRASFSTRLHHELARAKRYEKTFAVQLLDLNRFKFINDTLGHQAGDLLLQQVATRLSSCVRETDMVARVGGDEFVVIQTDLRTVGEAGLLAKKIIKELSQPFKLEDSEVWK